MKWIEQAIKALTPVEQHTGLYIKRDDLFTPFGRGDVNGGKLRQALLYILQAKETVKEQHVVTGCSIHSPQSAIVAASAKAFDMPCTIYFGGTTQNKLNMMPMPILAKKHKATFKISNSGRHSVIYHEINKKHPNTLIIDYGMNARTNREAFFDVNAEQTKNIPDDVNTIVMTCGSSITSTGVILGCTKHKPNVKTIHLIGVAPNRMQKINDNLTGLGCTPTLQIKYYSLFDTPGFQYEKQQPFVYDNISLHPNYEAKALKCAMQLIPNMQDGKHLFWIVGAKPR